MRLSQLCKIFLVINQFLVIVEPIMAVGGFLNMFTHFKSSPKDFISGDHFNQKSLKVVKDAHDQTQQLSSVIKSFQFHYEVNQCSSTFWITRRNYLNSWNTLRMGKRKDEQSETKVQTLPLSLRHQQFDSMVYYLRIFITSTF